MRTGLPSSRLPWFRADFRVAGRLRNCRYEKSKKKRNVRLPRFERYFRIKYERPGPQANAGTVFGPGSASKAAHISSVSVSAGRSGRGPESVRPVDGDGALTPGDTSKAGRVEIGADGSKLRHGETGGIGPGRVAHRLVRVNE